MVELSELKRRLSRPRPGRAILFTGAGFSDGAVNSLGEPIPLARVFAETLADEIGERRDLPLTLVSELYNEKKNDPSALLNLLKATFTAKQITPEQQRILHYPWKRIYTTNYDDVAEHVPSTDGTRPESFSRNSLPLNFEGAQRQIVHINGFVGELGREAVVDDFALTLSSYFDKNLFSSAWATTLRQDFELADLIVFAGYSLYDADITNILGQNPALRAKTVLVQWSGLSPADERFLNRFGTVLKIGNSGLRDIVEEAIAGGPPKINVSGPENFHEVRLPENPPTIRVTDRDVDALLARGVFSRDLFFSSRINGGREYLAQRGVARLIVQGIEQVGSHVLVHSELGNGKSLLLEELIFLLLQRPFRVFILNRRTDSFAYDVEYFSGEASDCVAVIEDMIGNRDLIEALRSQVSRLRIVSTSRSSAFEVKFSDIRHLFSDVKVVDANKLIDVPDIQSLVQILNAGAYWKNFPNARTDSDKRRIIERQCRKEIGSVILGVVESQVLDERIRALFQGDRKFGNVPDAIILALCLNFIEMRPTFELLSELIGIDMFSVMSNFNDDYIREFFAISNIEIIARSPIMSAYLLKNFVSDDKLVNVLMGALTQSSARYRRAKRYRDINAKFLRFSFIEKLITSHNNKYDRIQDYYDRAGEIGYKDFSPHYWLQYAIAARGFKDYRSADRFFAEAKRIARRRPDFYTYQIDNAYAQFLLESRRDVDSWADYFDAFVEASTLSMQQTYSRDAGMYPYKVAAMFFDFFEVRSSKFSKRQKREAAELCKTWIDRIDNLPKQIQKNRIVALARDSVADSFDFLSEVR